MSKNKLFLAIFVVAAFGFFCFFPFSGEKNDSTRSWFNFNTVYAVDIMTQIGVSSLYYETYSGCTANPSSWAPYINYQTYLNWDAEGEMAFNLSSIPSSATISSAKIFAYEYYSYTSGNGYNYIQKITSSEYICNAAPQISSAPTNIGYSRIYNTAGWKSISISASQVPSASMFYVRWWGSNLNGGSTLLFNYAGPAAALSSCGNSNPSGATDCRPYIEIAYSVPVVAPEVSTNAASDVSETTATLNGSIDSNGYEDPTVYIYWGDNDGGTNPASWDHDENLGINGVGTFSKDISGLNPNTTYYYRSYAVNSGGSVWADNTVSFTTQASTPSPSTYNVFGWAWSENIGWISFNCNNPELPEESRCATNYGVHICTSEGDSLCSSVIAPKTGKFIGYAWSENIGWISFIPSGPYPSGSYSYSACLDLPGAGQVCDGVGDYQVSGWAKVLSNDSWIRLKGSTYGVQLDTSVTPYQFRGWAWSDTDVGWISFNCSNQGCLASDYKVTTSLSVPSEEGIPPVSSIISPDNGSWQKDDFNVVIQDVDYSGSGFDNNNCSISVTDHILPTDTPTNTDVNQGRNCGAQVSFNVKAGNESSDNCAEDWKPPIGQATCKVSTRAIDDDGGDSGLSSRNFRIDKTEPVVDQNSCAAQAGDICYSGSSCVTVNQGEEKSFCARVVDSLGKIDGCYLYVDGAYKDTGVVSPVPCQNGTNCTVFADYAFVTSGTHTIGFKCVDAAGNQSLISSMTVNVSTNHAPTISYANYTTSPCTSPTTQADCMVNFQVSASDEDGDNLTYSWIFGDGEFSDEQNPSHHYGTANNYTAIVTVSDGRGGTASKTISVPVGDPQLFVTLSANPSFGVAPPGLSGVTLRAIVGGTRSGNIDYYFDCNTADGVCFEDGNYSDCNHSATNKTAVDYTTPAVCSYSAAGNYTAAVLIRREGAVANDTASIKVIAAACNLGQTAICITPQGCDYTIVCQSGAWSSCPSNYYECAPGTTQSCGNCGIQSCESSCSWEEECEEPSWAVCSDNSECDCPADHCDADEGSTYYDYPQNGICTTSCTCEIGTGLGQACHPIITYNDTTNCSATLSVDLKASINGGPPWYDSLNNSGFLNDVHLWADVDGSMTGSINYKFDCTNDGIWDYTFDNTFEDPKTVADACDYTEAKTYTARVKVERGIGSAEDSVAITIYTTPPVADISCSENGCGSCNAGTSINPDIVYNRNCGLKYINESTDVDSTDPAHNNDIIRSTWSIYYSDGNPWADPYIICNDNPDTPLSNEAIEGCDLTIPSLPVGNYYARLGVEDKTGSWGGDYRYFTVLQDAIAEFDCSQAGTEGSWVSCENLTVPEGTPVCFRDKSFPSQGASLNSWSWKFDDGDPVVSIERNPCINKFSLKDWKSGEITLTVGDSAYRADTTTHRVKVTAPLPKWREVPPY